jgi:hypothetical protein
MPARRVKMFTPAVSGAIPVKIADVHEMQANPALSRLL